MTYRDDLQYMQTDEAACYPHAFMGFSFEDKATEIKKNSDKYTDNDTSSNNARPKVAIGLIYRTAS